MLFGVTPHEHQTQVAGMTWRFKGRIGQKKKNLMTIYFQFDLYILIYIVYYVQIRCYCEHSHLTGD